MKTVKVILAGGGFRTITGAYSVDVNGPWLIIKDVKGNGIAWVSAEHAIMVE